MTAVYDVKTQVARLRVDADKLYNEGNYEGARAAYSRGIELDPADAMLHANRAQANLALKKHEHALEDATKATELDSSSCKAWARRATAEQLLGRFRPAVSSWKRALEALPTRGQTDADKFMRLECERGLARTLQDATEAERRAQQARANEVHTNGSIPTQADGSEGDNNLPWERAAVQLPKLECERREHATSSAWVIFHAHQAFEKGKRGLERLVRREAEGGPQFDGEVGVIADLVAGVMRDARAFYMEGPEFLDRYNDQVQFELSKTDAWSSSDIETITREAQERLASKGWDDVRPAISTTINVWVMNGFLGQKVNQKAEDALEHFSRVLALLGWGHTVWADARPEDRGAVFSDEYERIVKRFYFQAFMAAYLNKPGEGSEYSLEDLHGMLREFIADTARKLPAIGQRGVDPGAISSFWLYPIAEAYSNLGWIHFRRAVEGLVGEAEIDAEFNLAAQFYIKAALGFDQDDEFYAYYLAEAVNALWSRQAPLLDVLPWCEKIVAMLPKMKAIWEWSQFRHARDPVLKQVVAFEQAAREKLERGELTIVDRLLPEAPPASEGGPTVVGRSRSY